MCQMFQMNFLFDALTFLVSSCTYLSHDKSSARRDDFRQHDMTFSLVFCLKEVLIFIEAKSIALAITYSRDTVLQD